MAHSALYYRVQTQILAKRLGTVLGESFQKPLNIRSATVVSGSQIALGGQRYELDTTGTMLEPGQMVRVRNVQRLAAAKFAMFDGWGGTGGTGSTTDTGDTVTAGADIIITGTGREKVVGRAGNRILLFDSGGAILAEYDPSSTGFDAALAAATSGDVVQVPAGTITGDHTIPSGVTVQGFGANSILSGTITNNGILQGVKIGDLVTLYQAGTATGWVWDPATGYIGLGIAPLDQLHIDCAAGADISVSSGSGGDSTLHLYTRSGDTYTGWVIAKDFNTGDFVIERATGHEVTTTSHFAIDATTGNVVIGSKTTQTDKLYVFGAIKATTQLKSAIATGTAPLVVASTTMVSNLNADMVDGKHANQLGGGALEPLCCGGEILFCGGDCLTIGVTL